MIFRKHRTLLHQYLLQKKYEKLVEKVRASKIKKKSFWDSYQENPKISVIIQFYNQIKNIYAIIGALRTSSVDEIIVCEDGSVDGSFEKWLEVLNQPNDFLIRSNDIHEIRSYDRAIHYAKGDLIFLIQDDDIPDSSGSWIKNALKLFETFPKLAILGGYRGGHPFRRFDTKQVNFGYLKKQIPYQLKNFQLPFMFVETVNIGPFIIDKHKFFELKGFDFSFSKVGQLGIHFDHELCLRAWKHGFQVGLYDSKFNQRVTFSGTSVFAKEDRNLQDRKNIEIIRKKYGNILPEITKSAKVLNEDFLEKINKETFDSLASSI